MSERSLVKDSWPRDIDVGGDMIAHVSPNLFSPPTVTCIVSADQFFFSSLFIKFGCSSVINI